jgi:2-haloacid dehalogenase
MQFELNRRRLLIAGLAASAAGAGGPPVAALARPLRAIAFDGFPIFDPRPVAAKAESLFPGRGDALMAAWRTRQFEYQWLRALAEDYADFLSATRDGLVFAARALKLELASTALDELVGAYTTLGIWPDVPPALKTLREAGYRLAIVSNMTQQMLDDGLRRAGIETAFDHVLSTDTIRSYKPSPRAYQLGVDALRLRREQILFVPFAGWDAAGAKTYGHPTYWVNRSHAPQEEWGASPDGTGQDMAGLLAFASAARARAT